VALGQFTVAGSIKVYTPASESNVTTTLTIDYSTGYFDVPEGINFTGSGNDSLNITGGSFAGIIDEARGPGAGSIDLTPAIGSGSAVNYSGVTSIAIAAGAAEINDRAAGRLSGWGAARLSSSGEGNTKSHERFLREYPFCRPYGHSKRQR